MTQTARWLYGVSMVSSRYGARLSQTDVVDLANASAQLVEVANTINRANPVWANAAVQVLIAVNQVIERLQNKGAAAFARYLERHGTETAQDEAVERAAPMFQEGERKPPQNEEES